MSDIDRQIKLNWFNLFSDMDRWIDF